eukprot:XP_012815035.1 PREDICTED: protein Lines homolog 1 isoform X2 [Xenopus tropicalis]
MEGLLPGLRELHRVVLNVGSLQHDAQKCASFLAPNSTALSSTDTADPTPADNEGHVSVWCAREVTALQLSLIRMLISRADSQGTDPDVKRQYTCIVDLLQQADLDKTLICLSVTSDMVLSHLSSKCLSCLVLFQLKTKNKVNIRWLQFCLKSLSESPRCYTVMPCLSTLICVFKGLLRDENLQQGEKLQSVMDQLLAFLRHHLGWQKPWHPCEWVSLVFIEQDDDMLEVANILLKMYLRCQNFWSQVPVCVNPGNEMGIWDGISHQFGCDPNCIFVLLLNSVAFDTSVLLDFLISSETCFLEYFVRYLKLLKEDWPRFCLTCTLLELASCRKGSARDVPNSFPLQGQTESVAAAVVLQSPVNLQASLSLPTSITNSVTQKNVRHVAPSQVSSYECTSSLGALQRLVAYDSSEDSDSECSEEQDHPLAAQTPRADSTDIYKQMGKLKLKGECPAFSTTPTKTAENTNLITGTLLKSARCLEELQQAINRLHRKQLFPYNPSALLRLLIHVCTLNREMREGKISH